jgi:hypothetical protein
VTDDGFLLWMLAGISALGVIALIAIALTA